MLLRLLKFLPIAGLLLSCSPVQAGIPPACDADESCSKPLQDITVVTPGQFVVAKLHCYDCPTVTWNGTGSSRRHRIAHEENSLFYNISISNSKTELLLNDVPIFPLAKSVGSTEQPPHIYFSQVPDNFSLSDLLSTIECTHQPCGSYDGRCFCIPWSASLGSMGVDYEYIFSPKEVEDGPDGTPQGRERWTLSFDALGGYNGYMSDPFAPFESPEQKLLHVELEQDEHSGLTILGANLAPREHMPQAPPPRSFWENVLHFFGVREEMEEGHVILRQSEWDMYGRTGTLSNLLKEIWYGWQWWLIFTIVGSVIGGLMLLYAIYRFYCFVDNESRKGNTIWATKGRDETWTRERGYYLEETGDEEEASGLLAGDEDTDDDNDNEAALSARDV